MAKGKSIAGSHEDFTREVRRRPTSDRNFGFVFTAAFLLFAFVPLLKHRPVRVWCIIASAAFFFLSVFRPGVLHYPNRLWTGLGTLLGKVMNPAITALLFYLVFTPIALLLRLFGKDLLALKLRPEAQTYWTSREQPSDPAGMANQF